MHVLTAGWCPVFASSVPGKKAGVSAGPTAGPFLNPIRAVRESSPPGGREFLFLKEKFHLYAGELDYIVILQEARLRIQSMPVHLGGGCALDVSDEIALGPTGNDGNLYTRLAQGGEVLHQVEFLSGPGTAENLYGAQYVRIGRRRPGSTRRRC